MQLASVNIAALVLALIATGLRCFVRIRLLKAFGTDDWLMVAAAVCAFARSVITERVAPVMLTGPNSYQACFVCYCSFSLSGVAHGTGQHVANLSKEANSEARKVSGSPSPRVLEPARAVSDTQVQWWWLCYPSYAVTMTLTKLSITFFFRRIIVERVHKWILHGAMAVTIISCSVFFFACVFQCWPVSYFWDNYTQTGTCIPDRVVIALALLFSAVNIVTDFTFALMPAWILSHLNMRRKTKLALCGLMALGCM